MAAVSPDPANPSSAEPLHIVVLGLPAAGKTSLLGALGEATHAQPELLHGRLIDASHHLDELRAVLYAGGPPSTTDEVIPYAVEFEPFANGQPSPTEHVPAVLIDCDGDAASALLRQAIASAEADSRAALAREVAGADTIVLAIDAASAQEQMDATFQEFDLFLQQMEQRRGRRTEVAGLPVFLVLTKCDLLARPGDTITDWMERIETHKREMQERFRSFLERHPEAKAVFGRIDLHLWATAIQRPASPGVARPREPYGVAELFRQCLEEAVGYRGSRRRSERRLAWTVGGAAGLAVVLTALVVGQVIDNYSTASSPLEREVLNLRAADRTAADRLRGATTDLRVRLAMLERIRNDPNFSSLPRDEQRWVEERIKEATSYLAYFERLRRSPRPGELDTVEDLEKLQRSLQGELALPSPEWEATDAGTLHRDRLRDTEGLRKAVARMRDWYKDASTRATELWTFREFGAGVGAADIDWQTWSGNVEDLLSPAGPVPVQDAEVIPGTGLTYARTQHFGPVKDARADWQNDRTRLRRLLDVASALGLATAKDRPATLVLPREMTMEQVRQRLQELQQAYPAFEKDFTLDNLPDAIRSKARQVARTNYGHLLPPGQAEVLRQLQQAGNGAEETAARWKAVREWLKKPEELAAWRTLAGALLRLSEPDPRDPVEALEAFLAKDTFALTFQRILVDIPDSMPKMKPGADAHFEIYHAATAADGPALKLAPSGEAEHVASARAYRYTFILPNRQSLTYTVGDRLSASLRMREDQTLLWNRSRSNLYRLECLRRPPLLHRNGEPAGEGTLQEGIRLGFDPEDGVPRVPDLLPQVRLEGR
jgi:hypothetical protein